MIVSPRREKVLPSRPLKTDGLPRCGSGGGVRVGPGPTSGRGRVATDSFDCLRLAGWFGRAGEREVMRDCI